MSTGSTPVYVHNWPNLRIAVIGKPTNFRIGNWQEPAEYQGVARVAVQLGVTEIFVPQPNQFNGKIAKPEEFSQQAKFSNGVIVHYGHQADGLLLPQGTATAILTGDCPTITAITRTSNGPIVVVAHAGCLSLLPEPFGTKPSVVENLLKPFPPYTRGRMGVFVSCHIQATHFRYPVDDPKYGQVNQARRDHIHAHYPESAHLILPDEQGGLDLFQLIRAQFKKAGFSEEMVVDDGLNTATNPHLWSHRRDGSKAGRNAIIVSHF